eukprot:12764929-Prorocentrum_lima.AAC.1
MHGNEPLPTRGGEVSCGGGCSRRAGACPKLRGPVSLTSCALLVKMRTMWYTSTGAALALHWNGSRRSPSTRPI